MNINIISPVSSARDKIINKTYIVHRILRFRSGHPKYPYSSLNVNMSKTALPLLRSIGLDHPRMMYDPLLAIVVPQFLKSM